MSKKLKIAIGVIAVIIIGGFAGYKYVMTGGARHVETEDAAFTTTAAQLTKEFGENEQAASKKYLNKAIALSGEVTAAEGNTATLNGTVICTLHDSTATATVGTPLSLKGRVVGYDDLMQEVRVDECFITEQKK